MPERTWIFDSTKTEAINMGKVTGMRKEVDKEGVRLELTFDNATTIDVDDSVMVRRILDWLSGREVR